MDIIQHIYILLVICIGSGIILLVMKAKLVNSERINNKALTTLQQENERLKSKHNSQYIQDALLYEKIYNKCNEKIKNNTVINAMDYYNILLEEYKKIYGENFEISNISDKFWWDNAIMFVMFVNTDENNVNMFLRIIQQQQQIIEERIEKG